MGRPTTRRAILQGVAATAALSAAGRTVRADLRGDWDTIVVGAGVFGAWTAWHLRQRRPARAAARRLGPGERARLVRRRVAHDAHDLRRGRRVHAHGLGLARRTGAGCRARAGLPIFHPTGVLMFFGRREPFVDQSIEAHKRLGLRLDVLDRARAASSAIRRSPGTASSSACSSRTSASLMARRAVQTLVQEFVAAGGDVSAGRGRCPPATARRSTACTRAASETLRAERYVFACGPWLPKVFPSLLGHADLPDAAGGVLLRARGRRRRASCPPSLPGWADFNDGDIYYGMPDLEARGFKIAHDQHGERFDPDTGDRTPSASRHGRRARVPGAALSRRSPRGRSSSRASASTRTARTATSLIDRHPQWANALLVGAGSGHGFKHGPAVGRYAADLVTGRRDKPEPRLAWRPRATSSSAKCTDIGRRRLDKAVTAAVVIASRDARNSNRAKTLNEEAFMVSLRHRFLALVAPGDRRHSLRAPSPSHAADAAHQRHRARRAGRRQCPAPPSCSPTRRRRPRRPP